MEDRDFSLLFPGRIALYPIGASPRAGDNVLFPFDLDIWPEDDAKEVKFGSAESLTRGSRGADWAVIFHKQKGSIFADFDLGHVALFRSHASKLLKLLLERSRRRNPFTIRGPLAGAARLQHALQAFFPKCISHGRDERKIEFRIGVREKPIGFPGQLPMFGRAADGDGVFLDRHQSL